MKYSSSPDRSVPGVMLFDILVLQHNNIIQCLITLLVEQFELVYCYLKMKTS